MDLHISSTDFSKEVYCFRCQSVCSKTNSSTTNTNGSSSAGVYNFFSFCKSMTRDTDNVTSKFYTIKISEVLIVEESSQSCLSSCFCSISSRNCNNRSFYVIETRSSKIDIFNLSYKLSYKSGTTASISICNSNFWWIYNIITSS